jgi:uncharacterized membrane protein YfcA
MSSLSSLGLAFYVLVLIGAFAVRSAAGFGAGLIAVPMLAFVLPVPTAVSVATALTLVTSAQQVRRDWSRIAWAQFFIVSFYTMIGIGLGFYFISTLDENALRRGLGGFLVLYSIYALWTRGASPVLPTRWHHALAACAGIIGGFFGALFGGGVGPIYVIYFNVLQMRRDVFRVTMSTIMLVAVSARITGYASFGFYGRSTITLLALGLPLVFVGSWLGDRLAQRLDPRRFSYVIGGLVLLSGVALLLR